MIIGVFLRHFKTYSGTYYIPLSSGSNFCGLVGNNGIGKSSILEAFDSLFNGKDWNINSGQKKASNAIAKPHIVPVFMIKKSELPNKYHDTANILTKLAIHFDEKSVGSPLTPTTRPPVITFIEHMRKVIRNVNTSDYFILPLGCDSDRKVNLSILNCKSLIDLINPSADEIKNGRLNDLSLINSFHQLFVYLKLTHEYIYIPKDIDPETFTKLETKEIQKLMGESLEQIIKQKIPDETISTINNDLNSFISQVEQELDIYSYRTNGDNQQNLKRADVYNLIIEAFFKIRKINKKESSGWIEIGSLSSGEKQKAIIDIAQGFLTNHRDNGDRLIIGIDEPECSLHMSACFEQFENIFKISKNCRQLIFTTHWYGYLPTVEDGCTTSIIKENSNHYFDLYDLAGYREEIRKKSKEAKERIPYDIRLKSTNDLIQSILSSSLSENPYNWLICEGSTEKVYLSYYLHDLVETKKLRIVPVGGAKEVKKIFQLLESSHDDLRKDINGKIYLLSDTDRELTTYHVNQIDKIKCKRLVNNHKNNSTILVDIHSNKVSPPTEIEDCLNGFSFSKTLETFKIDFKYLDKLLHGKNFDNNMISFFSMNLTVSEQKQLEEFFDTDGIKYEFAKRYVHIDEISKTEKSRKTSVPNWIEEIRGFFQ
ncbi:AAA family ATPase [Kosakonia radicincitans]|uniref:AAA family ATPase n=1 Tax=Kosakonia radicincitans TaxID=283686 RepID=UPI0008BEA7FD|nr:AAA family ATPase [Kosakonia radicincitans]SET28001.1 AAA domain-containing protein, putative AbiEii toxin, Type IV TA system [Kosakonia radicincitans]